MPYTYDTKPSGSYTSDSESSAILTWGQAKLRTWGEAKNYTWGAGGANFTYDTIPTQDVSAPVGEAIVGATLQVSIYEYDQKPS